MNVPSVNVTQSENGFNIELAAPGLNKEDFKINVEKDRLTVSSEKQHEEEVSEEKYTRREFNYSSFSRSFYLPKSIDREAIEASYENGVLKLSLPKKQEVLREEMGRSIEIK
jgi:HSP20 family protein